MSTDTDLENALLDCLTASEHGIKRVRERLGLPMSAVEKEIRRAHDRGTPRQQMSGRMRRTLDYLHIRHGRFGDYRVYRGCVFVFKGDTFVTVFPLTNGLHNSKAARA